MKLTVILSPEPDGGYSVISPAILGCVSQGDSLPDALKNIREAIQLCLEVRREDHLPAVVETPEMIAREIEEGSASGVRSCNHALPTGRASNVGFQDLTPVRGAAGGE